MPRVPGVDVSRWQRRVDWASVAAAGYRFAFIRATIGGDYVDPRFYVNWDGARSAGLLISPYHVLRPDIPPDEQVSFFLQTLGGRRGDLPTVLDVERDDGLGPEAITHAVMAVLAALETHDERKPIVYTARWCWDRWVLPRSHWRDYDLWVASYTSAPFLPRDWDAWTFWQYSDRGKVPGVGAGATDLNWFAGSLEDLQRYADRRDGGADDQEGEEPSQPECHVRARVLASDLAIRNGPGAEYERLGTLAAETEVEVLSLAGSDVWIEFEPGRWAAFTRQGERCMRLTHEDVQG
jgi:lysozyme